MYISNYLISGLFLMILSFSAVAEEVVTEKAPDYSIIHAGLLLAIPGEEPLSRQSVIIKDGKIIEIREGYVTASDVHLKKPKVINLKDYFVLPGLMDMHVHLTMSRLNRAGAKKEGAGSYQVIEGLINAEKTLHAGYTTVRNVGSQGNAIFALRAAINRGDFPGPRILTAGHTLYVTTDEDYPGACYSVESCRKAVRKQIDMGADVIKIYVTCSGSKPCGREKAPALFLEDELKAVVETAQTREMKVAAHAHGTAGINAALRAGVSSIEHGSYNDKKSHKLFKKYGAFLVPTLSVEDNVAKDYKTATGAMKEVMEGFMKNHPARAFAAYKAGVQFAAGSDAGVTEHGNNVRELEWYVKIGMSEMEAIKSATVNGAKLIGMVDKLGSLEGGKLADIIAVKGNPLKDITALRHIHFVMKEGKIY